MPQLRQIVLVGHCGPDAYRLKAAVNRAVPEAEIITVDDEQRLDEYRTADHLWLVNRILDGRFATDSGIKLIRQTRVDSEPLALPEPPAMILISDLPEAQAEAIAAGARPGFGKTEVFEDRTAEILREAAKR
ncbi:MAG: hypothetical protein SYC29_01520 [Planctomycetota bacterium]|nr:hypothetical protein [Planctomycetota bacterium]